MARYIDADEFKKVVIECSKPLNKLEMTTALCELIDTQSSVDVVELSVFKKMLENAMAIPKLMHLYIWFNDEHVEKHMVTRFSDLSQIAPFYYYEEPCHEHGKGKTFRRDEIKCFEVSFCPLQNWEQHLTKVEE